MWLNREPQAPEILKISHEVAAKLSLGPIVSIWGEIHFYNLLVLIVGPQTSSTGASS